MNNAQKIAGEIMLVTEGLADVDVVARPPRIQWGDDFLAWPDEKKLSYLMKFAESMNHAAATVQEERDKLGKLCELKEKKLEQLAGQLRANNEMLQQEITRMNAQRQDYNKTIAELNAKVRELSA